uniref:Uncharacterized protein n=1 Tax=Rhizophora mucronata TaxID=61149 RepID=A0A2P2PHH9_RHIMU
MNSPVENERKGGSTG